ncbi:KRAB-A domain-containing protein 2-like [Palaemon carinicauda]|uniref:KRAB-A domain-containing protein 2-like n=1 Tax=Palaemon carinicauda TaxID=392227 RepID=UPI0035B5E4FC
MVYQCLLKTFIILRSLNCKRAAEVAFQLLDIFFLLGAPANLQNDNGSESAAHVITQLKQFLPQLKLVYSKHRHPKSQVSVERANADIKDILVAWMSDNNPQGEIVGLEFVQQQKNCALYARINRTLYKAMFGEDPKVGLTWSSLPSEILERLQSEDDLQAALQPPLSTNTESISDEVDVQI